MLVGAGHVAVTITEEREPHETYVFITNLKKYNIQIRHFKQDYLQEMSLLLLPFRAVCDITFHESQY
jgi:hypothetical protein